MYLSSYSTCFIKNLILSLALIIILNQPTTMIIGENIYNFCQFADHFDWNLIKNGFQIFVLVLIFQYSSAQFTAIPDANFEQALLDLGIDTDGSLNRQISDADAAVPTSLDVTFQSISDLTGIGAFVNLTFLNCSINQLTSLDVSTNTMLTSLNCSFNQLTSLDVSTNTMLTSLNCSGNLLTSLDVSTNTMLTSLDCSFNQLTCLDVRNGNNTAIGFFLAINNPDLTSILVDDVGYAIANFTMVDADVVFSVNEAGCSIIEIIPTLSQWSLIILGLCLSIFGVVFMMQKNIVLD